MYVLKNGHNYKMAMGSMTSVINIGLGGVVEYKINNFKYYVSCTDGRFQLESKFELPLFLGFTVVPFN